MWRPKSWEEDTTGWGYAEKYEAGADAMLKSVLDAMPSHEVFKQQIMRALYHDLDMADLLKWIYASFRGQFEEQK